MPLGKVAGLFAPFSRMKLSKLNLYQLIIGIALGVIGSVGFMTLRNQTHPAPIVIEPAPTAVPPAATPTAGPLTVFVNGAVNEPGIYELLPNARVQDVVAAAGGFSDNAFTDGVNLAQVVFDGAQVYVPRQEDSVEVQQQLFANTIQGTPVATESDSNGETSGINTNGLINLNTATRAELEQIPGVGEATAQKIVSYREDNGPFTDIEEVMNVSGIGESKFAQMQDSITIGE